MYAKFVTMKLRKSDLSGYRYVFGDFHLDS